MTTYGRINGLRFETVGALDIYVDPTGGSDSNPGTQALPIQTLAEAETRVPYLIQHPVTIHMLADDYTVMPWRPRAFSQPIWFQADDVWDPTVFTEVVAPQAAQAGTGAEVVVSGGGLGVDALFDDGDWIEFLNGAAVGQRRTIQSNTAANIVPMLRFSPAPAPGDSFVVRRSDACRMLFSGSVVLNPSFLGTGPQDASLLFLARQTFAGFAFSGIEFRSSDSFAALAFENLTAAMFGCRKAYGGAPAAGDGCQLVLLSAQVATGTTPGFDPFSAPAPLTNAPFNLPTAERWYGWGLSQAPSDRAAVVLLYRSHADMIVGASQFDLFDRSESSLTFAGRLKGRAGDSSSPLTVEAGVAVNCVVPFGQTIKNRVDAIEARHAVSVSIAGSPAWSQVGGARCALDTLALTSVNGDCLRVEHDGLASITNTVTGAPSGTGLAVRSILGGRVLLRGAPALGAAGPTLDYSVGNGANQNKGFFATAGDSMANAVDGSYITRVS